MNYSEMLFNRDEKIIKIIEEKDKEIDKLTAESTEWESKYYDMLDNFHNANEEIDKQKEVLDKIKEYITTIDTDYAIGCWNKDEEFVDVKKDILELLEEIE